ncbi:ABC transporter [Anaerocolumna cellulosilytica]|uniref:ABC transporter n=1 Tax=Anaerocolumna cellulosilytica TaxID=433286 RepID=A0A6S6R9H7_9FIRM|nr:ABC transporter permease [Anaerocolumna cellulosilytica]MBB5195323.1 multidrug/hemolysin transport system permease protein [Anaerocolumna cellulosilytica]BCJ96797.1 ABC transporter [Anaerocolumna cellulosilytica]
MTFQRFVKRNLLVYIRNRSHVFFSLLSMLIIIGLMAVFLGKMNADNVVDLLAAYGGERDVIRDRANAEQLVLMWTLAGIVVVNSVTITLAMVGIMVQDEENKKLSCFYVSPVNRGIFVLGYITAAIIMGIIMCVITVFLGEVFILISGGTLLSVSAFFEVLLWIVLNVFMSATLVFFIACFVNNTSAYSGLSTIVGTLVGFLSAIYLPMGSLSEGIQNILKALPLLHGCSLMRDAFTREAAEIAFKGLPKEVLSGYSEYMGISITWGEENLTMGSKVAFLLISGIIFIAISGIIQRRRNTVLR